MVFNKTFGSRAEVFHGNAKKTTGGLMKKNLMKVMCQQVATPGGSYPLSFIEVMALLHGVSPYEICPHYIC